MSIEAIPRTERYEFDPAFRDLAIQPRRSDRAERLVSFAGRVALRDCRDRSGLDPRGGKDDLSPEDIEQLEEYFGFLRDQYGIPKGEPVFPRRPKHAESTSSRLAAEENDDEV